MDKNKLAFTRKNYILMAIGIAVVIIGFLLMTGAGSTETHFDPEIFASQRIKLAPAVCFVGFVLVAMAILYPSKRNSNEADDDKTQITKE